MFGDKCSSNDDHCHFGKCGCLNTDDSDNICCGYVVDSSLPLDLVGDDFCLGTTKIGESCLFNTQCEDHGYCDNSKLDLITNQPGQCQKAIENNNACENDDECRSGWCDKKKCKTKYTVGESCNGDVKNEFESDS